MRNSQLVALVIIPTYNEAGSVQTLVQRFEQTLIRCPTWELRLLFVDGNSPDGTSELIRNLQRTHGNIDLIVEDKKGGIGAAYIIGFTWAIQKYHPAILVEFDGDLQHSPEIIPDLIEAIEGGADCVMGSRKIAGGDYPDGWKRIRRFYSRFGGFLARMILFFPSSVFRRITDPTTGLRATRLLGVLDQVNPNTIRSKGFGYKLELLYKITKVTEEIREIPLKFSNRAAGKSKMTRYTPIELLSTALRVRFANGRV